jgi:hypothetical protein
VVLAVLARLDGGESARAVAVATGIPYETIRKWQRGRIPLKARRMAEGAHWCAGCGAEEHDFSALPSRQYAYLLGIYLGDGCLYRHKRGTYGLKVTLGWSSRRIRAPGHVCSRSTDVGASTIVASS